MNINFKNDFDQLNRWAEKLETEIENAIEYIQSKNEKEKFIHYTAMGCDKYYRVSHDDLVYVVSVALNDLYKMYYMDLVKINLEHDNGLLITNLKYKEKKEYFNKKVEINNKEYTITISDSAESDDMLDVTVHRQRSIPGHLVKTIKFNK